MLLDLGDITAQNIQQIPGRSIVIKNLAEAYDPSDEVSLCSGESLNVPPIHGENNFVTTHSKAVRNHTKSQVRGKTRSDEFRNRLSRDFY